MQVSFIIFDFNFLPRLNKRFDFSTLWWLLKVIMMNNWLYFGIFRFVVPLNSISLFLIFFFKQRFLLLPLTSSSEQTFRFLYYLVVAESHYDEKLVVLRNLNLLFLGS